MLLMFSIVFRYVRKKYNSWTVLLLLGVLCCCLYVPCPFFQITVQVLVMVSIGYFSVRYRSLFYSVLHYYYTVQFVSLYLIVFSQYCIVNSLPVKLYLWYGTWFIVNVLERFHVRYNFKWHFHVFCDGTVHVIRFSVGV